MSELLVDTDILIDIANNDIVAKNRIQQESQTKQLAISTITVMELTVGSRNKSEVRSLKHFLRQFQIVRINPKISDEAVNLIENYSLSHGLKIPDALIAATAIDYDIPLLSKNQRDYRFIAKLNLLSYP